MQMTPCAAASGRPPPASPRIKSEQQFPPEPWSLVTSNKKKEKWHFFLSPVNSSIPQIVLMTSSSAAVYSKLSHPLTPRGPHLGGEPWFPGLTHLEVTVFESGVLCNPFSLWLTQPSGREVFSNFVPWEIALWSSHSKELQGRTVRSRLVFRHIFIFIFTFLSSFRLDLRNDIGFFESILPVFFLQSGKALLDRSYERINWYGKWPESIELNWL